MSGKVYLDFEYNQSNEPMLHVLCVAYIWKKDGHGGSGKSWLQSDHARERFVELVESWIADGFTFVAFAVTAEARSLWSLGVNPLRIKWADLQIEWRMMTNHNHELGTGKHLIKGKEVNIRPAVPKWMKEEGAEKSGTVEHSLIACAFKMLGVNLDSEKKNEMRDLILSKNVFAPEERKEILKYCESDVVYLPEIHIRLYKALYLKYDKSHRTNINEEILLRGEYAAATAIMEAFGYPIDYDATRSFSDSTRAILFDMQKEVADDFPDIEPFRIDRKGVKYTQKKKNIQKYIQDTGDLADNWMLTDKGALSLKLDAFQKHFSSKNDQSIFGNRFVKYLRAKQALNGFMPGKKSKTIWDFVGSDSRVPTLLRYLSRSVRAQPAKRHELHTFKVKVDEGPDPAAARKGNCCDRLRSAGIPPRGSAQRRQGNDRCVSFR